MITQLLRQAVLVGKSSALVASARSFTLSAQQGARYGARSCASGYSVNVGLAVASEIRCSIPICPTLSSYDLQALFIIKEELPRPWKNGSRFTQQTFTTPRTGGALREKLFGPATQKPFVYGSYALAGASLAGIGMLCWYGLGMSKDISIVNKAALWPQEVRDRLKSTYGHLVGSVLMTGGFGYLASRSPVLLRMSAGGGLMATLGWCAAMIAAGVACRSIPYDNTLVKYMAWATHCGVLGACFASLALVGGPVLMRAAWYTAAITAGLSTTAACAPSEKFLYMGGALSMGLAVMFAACLGSFLLPPHSMAAAGMASFIMYGGLILFGGFLLYDTQKVVKMAERHNDYRYNFDGSVVKSSFDPINAQMSIFMDMVNIFIRLVWIFQGQGNRRK
uniref:Growth hormone-inducible transmembrane protein n=1 Tax=Steinernema glaseri TaxID=37863 RepID=A0A1I7Y2I9_9BILA